MRPTRALIYQSHLLANLETVRRALSRNTAICAAVKANAYGHGASTVARWLSDAGVQAFGVATVEEGVELREAGIAQPILLLGTLQNDEFAEAADANLDLFVWTTDAATRADQAFGARHKKGRVHLKVDTGMSRVGCRPEQAEVVAEVIMQSKNLALAGLCTHFAASDGPGPVSVEEQLGKFSVAQEYLKARGWLPEWVHASNSGAVQSYPSAHFSMARPGIILYGYGRAPEAPELLPVMEWVSRVGFVKEVPAGTPVSYGSRFITNRKTRLATIPVGYADGYRRSWTNKAKVWIEGALYPVVGTICMDQMMVDLGPDSKIREGAQVVLMGPRRVDNDAPWDADQLADAAATISYEVLCGVSSRVPRVPVLA